MDELDYEQRQSYELLIRATDSVSGVSAEVPVSVLVQDVNDCPPEIEQDSYNITVSERAQFGTAILKVQAKDNDTGKFGWEGRVNPFCCFPYDGVSDELDIFFFRWWANHLLHDTMALQTDDNACNGPEGRDIRVH